MQADIQLTPEAARNLQLATLGLLQPRCSPAVKDDVLDTIRNLGALQIDTIHVVARSPYLTLYSRLGNYRTEWLDELLAEGALFEYWAHAACFLPVEDFPLYRRYMLDNRHCWWDSRRWIREHPELIKQVLNRIQTEGPLRSADFENRRKQPGGWWNWKEEKVALEHLHTAGVLMIARRENFQRVYDLAGRVLPGWDDRLTPSLEEVRQTLILRTVQILGVTQGRWTADYFRLPKRETTGLLPLLAEKGELLQIEVEGWQEPAYVHPQRLPLLEAAARGDLQPELSAVLSPFDPLVWDRERCKALFGFNYSLECYLPAGKRRYGYFCLPLLVKGALVGRIDAKAHRQAGIFEVKALHLEPEVTLDETLAGEIVSAIRRCAAWHSTPEVSANTPEIAWLNG